jgi:hypothetical protein
MPRSPGSGAILASRAGVSCSRPSRFFRDGCCGVAWAQRPAGQAARGARAVARENRGSTGGSAPPSRSRERDEGNFHGGPLDGQIDSREDWAAAEHPYDVVRVLPWDTLAEAGRWHRSAPQHEPTHDGTAYELDPEASSDAVAHYRWLPPRTVYPAAHTTPNAFRPMARRIRAGPAFCTSGWPASRMS